MFFFKSELKALRYQRPELCQKLIEVKFDARGLKHHLPDHGITVIIPENAVATEELLFMIPGQFSFLQATGLCQKCSGLKVAPTCRKMLNYNYMCHTL